MQTDQPKMRVETTTYPDGRIERRVTDIVGQVTQFVFDSRDAGVRDALIKLGWQPPEVAQEVASKDAELHRLRTAIEKFADEWQEGVEELGDGRGWKFYCVDADEILAGCAQELRNLLEKKK